MPGTAVVPWGEGCWDAGATAIPVWGCSSPAWTLVTLKGETQPFPQLLLHEPLTETTYVSLECELHEDRTRVLSPPCPQHGAWQRRHLLNGHRLHKEVTRPHFKEPYTPGHMPAAPRMQRAAHMWSHTHTCTHTHEHTHGACTSAKHKYQHTGDPCMTHRTSLMTRGHMLAQSGHHPNQSQNRYTQVQTDDDEQRMGFQRQ